MVSKMILTHRAGYLRRQEAFAKCCNPVPPNKELRLAALIGSWRVYEHTLKQARESKNEFTVRCLKDGSQTKKIVPPSSDHVIACLCGYSTTLDVFPCPNRFLFFVILLDN